MELHHMVYLPAQQLAVIKLQQPEQDWVSTAVMCRGGYQRMFVVCITKQFFCPACNLQRSAAQHSTAQHSTAQQPRCAQVHT